MWAKCLNPWICGRRGPYCVRKQQSKGVCENFSKKMGCFGDRRKSVVSIVITESRHSLGHLGFIRLLYRSCLALRSQKPSDEDLLSTLVCEYAHPFCFTFVAWPPEYSPIPNTRGNPRWHICIGEEVSRESQESTSSRARASLSIQWLRQLGRLEAREQSNFNSTIAKEILTACRCGGLIAGVEVS